MKIYDTRDEYHNASLVTPDDEPIALFESWYADALKSESHSPNAMSVSTIGESGQPWCRMVLLKAVEKGCFVFFTNTESIKSNQISANSKVCLHFYWKSLHRQVQIHGVAAAIGRAAAVEYFLSRPLESQISSWVSEQSKPIASRQSLLDKLRSFTAKLPHPLPAPHHWGGYEVRPSRIEFWQGAEHRLHHRVVFDADRSAGAGAAEGLGQDQPVTFGRGVVLNP